MPVEVKPRPAKAVCVAAIGKVPEAMILKS
jgi:hypothetical protein